MKWYVVLPFAAWLMWLVNDKVDSQDYRIVQLECALAQAQVLLAEESLTTGDLGLDRP